MIKLIWHCFDRKVKRISRYHYWMSVLILFLMFYALDIGSFCLWKMYGMGKFLPILLCFINFFQVICLFILTLKRFHDAGYTIWRLIIYTMLSIVIVGILLILIVTIRKSEQVNIWGEPEKNVHRISVRSKAAICAIAVFLVSGTIFFYLEFFTGHVRSAEIHLNQSEKYSQEELSEAVSALKKEYFLKMWGGELQSIAYREWIDYGLTEEIKEEMGIGGEEEVIVLEAKSIVNYDSISLFSDTLVKGAKDDAEWVLARNKNNGKWRVVGTLGGG